MKERSGSLKILLALAVLAGSLAAAWAMFAFRPHLSVQAAEPLLPEVQVLRVEPQTLSLAVNSQGIVTPREEIDLITEVAGKVVGLHPALVAGGVFKANDVLLSIDSRDYDYAIVVARAQIAEANRILINEQAQVEQAQSEWQALGEGDASDLALRKPQLAEAQAKLAAARAELAKAEINRSRCELRAPFAGRVLSKQVGRGQFLSAGAVVARIYASDVTEIRLPVSSEQLAFLNLPPAFPNTPSGEWPRVIFSADIGGQHHRWQGHIVRSEAAISEDSGQWYLVAQVTEPSQSLGQQPPLLKGLFVQAEIEGKARDDLYRLPRHAVSSMQTVKLVNAEHKLEIRSVEVLRGEADSVVIQSGLKPGERVVVSEVPLPVAGMRVAERELLAVDAP